MSLVYYFTDPNLPSKWNDTLLPALLPHKVSIQMALGHKNVAQEHGLVSPWTCTIQSYRTASSSGGAKSFYTIADTSNSHSYAYSDPLVLKLNSPLDPLLTAASSFSSVAFLRPSSGPHILVIRGISIAKKDWTIRYGTCFRNDTTPSGSFLEISFTPFALDSPDLVYEWAKKHVPDPLPRPCFCNNVGDIAIQYVKLLQQNHII